MSEIIKRPKIDRVDFCVDENIWGHRLYDEQLPHLTVLEFLGVLGSNLDKPLRPHEDLGGAIKFKPQRQIRLRGLLFNNPYVESIAESALADEEKWRQWLEKFVQRGHKERRRRWRHGLPSPIVHELRRLFQGH